MAPEMHDHYIALVDRWQREADSYKAKLFDAWKSLRMQQKGLNRQARKMKRLHRELAEARETIKGLRGTHD